MHIQDYDKTVLIGSGGHARSVEAAAIGTDIKIVKVVLDSRELSEKDWNNLFANHQNFIIGVGQIYDYKPRAELYNKIKQGHGVNITLVAKDAFVAPTAHLLDGIVVMRKAVVNADAIIYHACIINTSAIIEHDARIGSFTHISTGAVVNGGAQVGHFCFVGSNSVILNGVRICDNVMIGAGSVVTHDINESGVYVGNPAKFLKEIPCQHI